MPIDYDSDKSDEVRADIEDDHVPYEPVSVASAVALCYMDYLFAVLSLIASKRPCGIIRKVSCNAELSPSTISGLFRRLGIVLQTNISPVDRELDLMVRWLDNPGTDEAKCYDSDITSDSLRRIFIRCADLCWDTDTPSPNEKAIASGLVASYMSFFRVARPILDQIRFTVDLSSVPSWGLGLFARDLDSETLKHIGTVNVKIAALKRSGRDVAVWKAALDPWLALHKITDRSLSMPDDGDSLALVFGPGSWINSACERCRNVDVVDLDKDHGSVHPSDNANDSPAHTRSLVVQSNDTDAPERLQAQRPQNRVIEMREILWHYGTDWHGAALSSCALCAETNTTTTAKNHDKSAISPRQRAVEPSDHRAKTLKKSTGARVASENRPSDTTVSGDQDAHEDQHQLTSLVGKSLKDILAVFMSPERDRYQPDLANHSHIVENSYDATEKETATLERLSQEHATSFEEMANLGESMKGWLEFGGVDLPIYRPDDWTCERCAKAGYKCYVPPLQIISPSDLGSKRRDQMPKDALGDLLEDSSDLIFASSVGCLRCAIDSQQCSHHWHEEGNHFSSRLTRAYNDTLGSWGDDHFWTVAPSTTRPPAPIDSTPLPVPSSQLAPLVMPSQASITPRHPVVASPQLGQLDQQPSATHLPSPPPLLQSAQLNHPENESSGCKDGPRGDRILKELDGGGRSGNPLKLVYIGAMWKRRATESAEELRRLKTAIAEYPDIADKITERASTSLPLFYARSDRVNAGSSIQVDTRIGAEDGQDRAGKRKAMSSTVTAPQADGKKVKKSKR